MATLKELIGYGSYTVTYYIYGKLEAKKTIHANSEAEARQKFEFKYRRYPIIDVKLKA
jgi:hypothetical protein